MAVNADKETDLVDFGLAIKALLKAPKTGSIGIDLAQIDTPLRDDDMNSYPIALEKGTSDVVTIVSPNGKLDCNHVLGCYLSDKQRRENAVERVCSRPPRMGGRRDPAQSPASKHEHAVGTSLAEWWFMYGLSWDGEGGELIEGLHEVMILGAKLRLCSSGIPIDGPAGPGA